MTLEYSVSAAVAGSHARGIDPIDVAEVRRLDETTWAVLRRGAVAGFIERSGHSYVGLVGREQDGASWLGQYSSAAEAIDAVHSA